MNKSELSQLKYLSKEIDLLQKQIENAEYAVDARMTTDTVTGSYPVWPYEKRTFRVKGVDVAGYERRVRRLKNKLRRRLEELIGQREELEEYIAEIPDSEMRTILTLRYVEGLTWDQVASSMGVQGDGSTERKKHDRFLKFSRNS